MLPIDRKYVGIGTSQSRLGPIPLTQTNWWRHFVD